MDQSPTIGKLSAALAKAQAKLKNPHFDSTNPHFKSKFASLAAVREAVVPIFSECAIAISQWPTSRDGSAGCRTVISCGDEWMAEEFLIPVDKHNAHGYASAVTYAKRIAMQSVAGVVGDDDDDGNNAVGDNVQGARAHGHIPAGDAKPEAWARLAKVDGEHKFLLAKAGEIRDLLAKDMPAEAYGVFRTAFAQMDEDEQLGLQYAMDQECSKAQLKALKEAGEKYRMQLKAMERQERKAA